MIIRVRVEISKDFFNEQEITISNHLYNMATTFLSHALEYLQLKSKSECD